MTDYAQQQPRGWMANALYAKRFEPVKRNKDGLQYIGHRFPIKGGISQAEVLQRGLIEMMSRPCALFTALVKNGTIPSNPAP